MILFVFTGQTPPVLVLALIVMAYLAGAELYKEKDLPVPWKAWWVLLVVLLNFVGLAIFWIWLTRRRRRADSAASPG